MANKGWDEFEIGAMLRSFDGKAADVIAETHQEDRNYSSNNSFTASVADWRILKPVFNKDYCIDCQFCWVYCPDISIISRDKKMVGVDMDHCKGCGICVEVCPTNPKSLLMYAEHADEETEIAQWPAKDEEKKIMAFDKMELRDVEVWDGNMAASQAMRQAQIDVVAAYPITPSTPVVENYATFLANNYIEGEFVMVESEHAAMSGCIGAAAAGGRVATATSSQGFALMVETLYQASGMRLPIVLNVVNRALAAPLNVNGDHSDMYLGRDSGWIQFDAYCPQDVYDLNLIAFKVCEDHDVRLPAMVHQDGFMTSHTAQGVNTLDDDTAYGFIGEYQPMNDMLDFEHPVTHGVQTEEDWHFEHKARQHNDLMTKVFPKIQAAFDEFEKLSGRKYNMVESYDMDDADVAVVCMGTSVETAREVATEMRAKGVKAGVVGIRVVRPFPFMEIADALKGAKAIAALDRSNPNGAPGMLFNELAGCMYNLDTRPMLSGYVYGLGGRDLTKVHLTDLYNELQANVDAGKILTPLQQFIGVRGPKLSFL